MAWLPKATMSGSPDLISMGESWHNNHHAFPGSAKMGLFPGQIDLGWWLIKTFETIGLATNCQDAGRPAAAAGDYGGWEGADNAEALVPGGHFRRIVSSAATADARGRQHFMPIADNTSLTLSALGSSGRRRAGCRVAKMSFAQKKTSTVPAAEERRRFQRVKVHLLGRYMLPDRREFPCQIINMSPGGLALLAPGIGNVGDRVIAYLDHIGRVEGKITRIIDNGFAMTRRRYRAQARQARRPAHLARQPRYPQSAGRPPPRPYRAAQPDRRCSRSRTAAR